MTSQSSMADPSKDRDLPEQAKPEPKTAALETNIEDAPDPGEDDLDDLDDMLDDFSAPRQQPPQANVDGKKPQNDPSDGILKNKTGNQAPLSDEAEDEFAKQLEAGMAELLGELESSPEMRQQLENLLVKDIGDGADVGAGAGASSSASKSHNPLTHPPLPSHAPQPSSAAATATASAPPENADSFQERIQRTMQRMQESGDQATLAATSSITNPTNPSSSNPSQSTPELTQDFLAEMLKQLQTSSSDPTNPTNPANGEGGEGQGGEEGPEEEEEFSKILLGMMEQLTNKEILYEPMKELNDKFPAWLEANRERLRGDKDGREELERYEVQRKLVREIVGRFERDGYSDEDLADREWIVVRMQKMQAAGAPPPDLVGNMSAAQEAIDELDSGCPQQ